MSGPGAHASRVVRIAVVGDSDTGKTSLISTAANDTFDARPVPVLPPTKLSPDYTPERVPLLLTDTSANPEASKTTDHVIQHADAVVVCFDPRRPITLENVRQVSTGHAAVASLPGGSGDPFSAQKCILWLYGRILLVSAWRLAVYPLEGLNAAKGCVVVL